MYTIKAVNSYMTYIKQILILLFFTYNGLSVTAQQYVTMPDTAVWRVRRTNTIGNHINQQSRTVDFSFVMDGSLDTINGLVYKRIIAHQHDTVMNLGIYPPVQNYAANQPDQVFHLREQGKQVFIKDLSTPEYLLYDFNLDTGAIWPSAGKITAIDSVYISGSYRKRYIIDPNGHSFHRQDTVIEGIGAMSGLHVWSLTPPVWTYLHCFNRDSVNIISRQGIPCTYVYPYVSPTSAPSLHGPSGWVVYPNPSDGELTIEGKISSRIYLSLYDNTGRLIKRSAKNSAPILLDISDVSNGLYLMLVTDESGYLLHKQAIVRR